MKKIYLSLVAAAMAVSINAMAEEPIATYTAPYCVEYPASWTAYGYNNSSIMDMGLGYDMTINVYENNHVTLTNWDGENHVLDFTYTRDSQGYLVATVSGAQGNYYYQTLSNNPNYYQIEVYCPYLDGEGFQANAANGYVIIPAYFDSAARGSDWGYLYFGWGNYKTTSWADAHANNNLLPVSTTPAEGEVTSLSTIILDWADDALVGGGGNATVYNEAGDVVTTADVTYGDDYNKYNEMKCVLRSEITEPGSYKVTFPQGTFLLGEQGDTTVPEFSLNYTIAAPVTLLFSTVGHYTNAGEWWGANYETYTDSELPFGFEVNVDVYSNNHVVLHNYLNSQNPAYNGYTDVEIIYDPATYYSTAIGGSADASIDYGSQYKGYFYTGLNGMYWCWMGDTSATVWPDESNGYVYIYNWLYGANNAQACGNYLIAWDNTVSINTVEQEKQSSVMFNLNGQRTNEAKGLVVKDGKIIMVK